MKKTILCYLPALFLLTSVIVSCKKDKDEPVSKTTLLTQKDWLAIKWEEKLNNDAYVDDFPNWPVCDKDDHFVFRTNNTYEANEGPTKCDATDPQIIDSGSWAFTDNETKILIGSQSYSIDQLDENTLVFSFSEVVGTDTYYAKITFGH